VDVVLVIIGDEILTGSTVDSNGGWLAQRLDGLGHRVSRIVVVGDDVDAIGETVADALRRAPIVITTGGLGPTHDDRTTESLARAFGRALVVDAEGLATLEKRYRERGLEPNEAARRMVTVPEGSLILRNPKGSALGYVLRENDRRVLVLPGVPAEMRAIFDSAVAGVILGDERGDRIVVEAVVYHPESAFSAELGRVAQAHPAVAIGSYPKAGEKRVVVRFRGGKAEAERARDEFLAALGTLDAEPRA